MIVVLSERETHTLSALSTGDTGLARVPVEGVLGVEPEHVRLVIVPDGHSENHTLLEALAHLGHSTIVGKVVEVTEELLLPLADLVGERVDVGETREG